MPSTTPRREVYSTWVGLIYIFNLIVGTGALTLPSVFAKAGWLLSTILLLVLAFISFVTVTFVIETMSCANESEATADSETEDEEGAEQSNEHTAIISGNRNLRKFFSLNEQVELGQMAGLYFNKIGRILFYTSLCIYLYGDLAIYTTAVSKSLSDLFCPNNRTQGNAITLKEEFNIDCFNDAITKVNLYRIFVAVFALCVCPFSYFNVQKTKYFQLATTSMRWCAFSIMIALASFKLFREGNTGHPKMIEVGGVPVLLGASVYSFMCHHSLPALIAPFSDKRFVRRQLAMDYGLISLFYLLLAVTGIFAFKELNDLYTLNFVPSGDEQVSVFMDIVLYFLGLFPVFTLSTSFPIIAITLQNNLKALFLDPLLADQYNFAVRRLTFPTLAVGPPIVVALLTHNLGNLVEFTGSYAGVCIQYIIPAMLVMQARKFSRRELGPRIFNKYASPFKSILWVHFIVCWSLICIILVTINLTGIYK